MGGAHQQRTPLGRISCPREHCHTVLGNLVWVTHMYANSTLHAEQWRMGGINTSVVPGSRVGPLTAAHSPPGSCVVPRTTRTRSTRVARRTHSVRWRGQGVSNFDRGRKGDGVGSPDYDIKRGVPFFPLEKGSATRLTRILGAGAGGDSHFLLPSQC